MTPMAEFVIVGAGLAGTALAWALHRRGRTVRLIDREPPTTTSRVAAGLLTPITGKKPAVSWRWGELRPAAERFYREVEATTGRSFFHSRPIVRVMTSAKEREAFTRSEFAGLVTPAEPPLDADAVPQPFGVVLMPTAAQLDTAAYLDASREHFTRLGVYERGEWDGRHADGVTVLCQGYVSGGAFPLPFRPAKGEILSVRIPGLNERRAINRG
jgi:glycine oxidase